MTSPNAAWSSLSLPSIGLGAAQLGNLGSAISDELASQLLDDAWTLGYRYFDTAPHYGLGLSETRLGQELKRHPRSEYFVSTKVGRLLIDRESGRAEKDNQGFDVESNKRRVWDFSRDGIYRSVESSLLRLGLDTIDLLLLHDPDDHFEQASTEGINALIELREQGVVRYVGAGMNHSGPLAELIRRADIDYVMCAGRLTLLDAQAEKDLLPIAVERQVGVIAAGVYNSGILAKKWPSSDSSFHYEQAGSEIVETARQIAMICERFDVELPDAAVAYVNHLPGIVSMVLGARNGKQLIDNLRRHRKKVDPRLWEKLRSAGFLG